MEQRHPGPTLTLLNYAEICALFSLVFGFFESLLTFLMMSQLLAPPTRPKLNYFIAGNSLNHAFMQFPDYIAGIPKWGICQFIGLFRPDRQPVGIFRRSHAPVTTLLFGNASWLVRAVVNISIMLVITFILLFTRPRKIDWVVIYFQTHAQSPKSLATRRDNANLTPPAEWNFIYVFTGRRTGKTVRNLSQELSPGKTEKTKTIIKIES